MAKESLTKLYINLPNHWATGGESLWAEELGDGLYRIRNVPFFAFGLNFHDIVRVTAESAELKHEIRNVVEFSGHKTLRIYFSDHVKKRKQVELLDQLKKHNASYERADDIRVAIDIEPEGSYPRVYDQLEEWENGGFLFFETCEAKNVDSFDDVHEDS